MSVDKFYNELFIHKKMKVRSYLHAVEKQTRKGAGLKLKLK